MASNAALRQGTTDHGAKLCLFGQKYCEATPQVVTILGNPCRCNGINYMVTDENEQPTFQVYRQCNSWRNKHIVQEYDGDDICVVKRKIGSWRFTYHLYGGADFQERRVTMAFKFCTIRPQAKIYIYEAPYPSRSDDTEVKEMAPSLIMKSTIMGFEIRLFNAETEETYATFSKALRCCANHYTVRVESGCDMALITGLLVMWDAVAQEKQGAAAGAAS